MKIPNSVSHLIFTVLILLGAALANANEADGTAKSFGPYDVVSINESVVRDVKVDKERNIFLKLNPEFKNREIVVKISNQLFENYRQWWHGELELVSPANNGKVDNGWTDRVQTQSNFIEYWMDGDIFLHLKLKVR